MEKEFKKIGISIDESSKIPGLLHLILEAECGLDFLFDILALIKKHSGSQVMKNSDIDPNIILDREIAEADYQFTEKGYDPRSKNL